MFEATRFPRRMSVSFTEVVGAELDTIAKKVNVPVAQVVRICVDQALTTVHEAADRLASGANTTAAPDARTPEPESTE